MSQECFANETVNDVEKYGIEITKIGQNYSFFLTWRWVSTPISIHLCQHTRAFNSESL